MSPWRCVSLSLRLGILVLFYGISPSAFSQTVVISCYDQQTLEPVPNVAIEINNSLMNLSVQTGPLGFVVVTEPRFFEHEKGIIYAEHPMYEPQSYRTNRLQVSQDTLEIKILLKALKQQRVNQVVVNAPGIPDTVFNSKEFHVADFEITNDGKYILLVYPKRNGRNNALLLMHGNTLLDSLEINDIGINLTKDYRDNIHVIGQESVYRVIHAMETLRLASIPKNYFLDYLVPIVDSTTSKVFFSNFNEFYPAFDYFAQDYLDSTYRNILHIEDRLMMELYRSEYKWVDVRTQLWAKRKEIETGIDAQIWVGANYFTQSIYYRVPYAPLFRIGDSVFVFDFPSDKMWVYNKTGELIRHTGLYFHYNKDRTGWRRNIVKDALTGNLYAVFEKDGVTTLGKIDLTKANISSRHRIYYKYVEKVRIHGGFAHYVYRPFESIQKRFLYKEHLLD